ncbi:LacI family DNA-binding transcriptional regulator [Clostridium weizhouense]|uniref:LacI family transcriptional regulator n=1 Tax=Clostridium weizhouense TaxID=2859781 RepID=A0ABS7AMU6_9CLOT|nr:LacI family DNA-binding transcriptional regulator [Clostridium weizhouense]MBW6409990.1 LacI family transcriptional regulator [Clostridium weizhouense]
MNIGDIAKLAGVGVSTVSRVINNHPDVKESTRERVWEVIKENKYIPNNSARILKQNNTKNIGVLIKGVSNPFFSQMINVIGKTIDKAGYTMILQQNDFSFCQDVENLIGFIKEKKLQGVICLGGNFIDITDESFSGLDTPIVLTSVNTMSKKGKANYSSVGIDNIKAAYDATKYLIDNGHKNIALLLGETNDFGVSWWRLNGYKNALEKENININDELILIGDYSCEKAYKETMNLLKIRKDVTAIFVLSDLMAIGAAKAVVDSGLKVGEDISIVGFDGMDESKYYNPGITTVKQPRNLMSEISVNLLLALINGSEEHKHILLDTQLIERESCKKLI